VQVGRCLQAVNSQNNYLIKPPPLVCLPCKMCKVNAWAPKPTSGSFSYHLVDENSAVTHTHSPTQMLLLVQLMGLDSLLMTGNIFCVQCLLIEQDDQLGDSDDSLLCPDLLPYVVNLQWIRARTSLTPRPPSRMVSLLLTSHDHATLVTRMIFPWISVGSCCMPMGLQQQLLLE